MSRIRVFIAVEIDQPHREKLTGLINRLKTSNADVKWANENQMHLTLKFLGNVEQEKIPQISDILEQISKGFEPFTIRFSQVGCFPNMKRPRVIWLGIDKGADVLKILADKIETCLEKLGFQREKRDYKAHLTLGRARTDKNMTELTNLINKANETNEPDNLNEPNEIKIYNLILFQSTLTPKGAIYTPLYKSHLK